MASHPVWGMREDEEASVDAGRWTVPLGLASDHLDCP